MATGGDRAAWDGLVQRHSGLVWTVITHHHLGAAASAEVSQLTWLRLAQHSGGAAGDPHVGAWLAAVAREECLRRGRDDHVLDRRDDTGPGVRLSTRCEQLLSLLALEPTPSYEEISAGTGMPLGSIGPSRLRCLVRLRQILDRDGTDSAARPSTRRDR